MIDLFKNIMANPLHGIVAALCIGLVANMTGLTEVRVAQAEMVAKQASNDQTTKLVFRMNETLIRVDENVNFLKKQIEKD